MVPILIWDVVPSLLYVTRFYTYKTDSLVCWSYARSQVAIILDAALNNRQGSRNAQSLQSNHVLVTA